MPDRLVPDQAWWDCTTILAGLDSLASAGKLSALLGGNRPKSQTRRQGGKDDSDQTAVPSEQWNGETRPLGVIEPHSNEQI